MEIDFEDLKKDMDDLYKRLKKYNDVEARKLKIKILKLRVITEEVESKVYVILDTLNKVDIKVFDYCWYKSGMNKDD